MHCSPSTCKLIWHSSRDHHPHNESRQRSAFQSSICLNSILIRLKAFFASSIVASSGSACRKPTKVTTGRTLQTSVKKSRLSRNCNWISELWIHNPLMGITHFYGSARLPPSQVKPICWHRWRQCSSTDWLTWVTGECCERDWYCLVVTFTGLRVAKIPREILPWKRIFFLNYLLILIYTWILL